MRKDLLYNQFFKLSNYFNGFIAVSFSQNIKNKTSTSRSEVEVRMLDVEVDSDTEIISC